MGIAVTDRDEECAAPARTGWGWLAVLLLGGYLLFAHGCHGDEDNELLAGISGPPVHARATGHARRPRAGSALGSAGPALGFLRVRAACRLHLAPKNVVGNTPGFLDLAARPVQERLKL